MALQDRDYYKEQLKPTGKPGNGKEWLIYAAIIIIIGFIIFFWACR